MNRISFFFISTFSTPSTPYYTMTLFPKPTSYYEQGFKRSPALERATAPFRVRNALTGAGLVIFCLSVYSYSIMAVKQDDFSDIELPAHVIEQQRKIREANEAKNV